MARSLCTPEVTERICQALRRGYFQKEAAAVGGIVETTYYNWLTWGRDALQPPNGDTPQPITTNPDGTPNLPPWITSQEKPYVVFLVSIVRARLEVEGEMLDVVQRVARGGAVVRRRTVERRDGSVDVDEQFAPPDARAAEWLLERSFRDRWSKADRLILTLDVIDDAIRREEQKALNGPVIDVLAEGDE